MGTQYTGAPRSIQSIRTRQRRKARLGDPQAVTATTHKLARLIDHLLRHRTGDVDMGKQAHEQPDQQRILEISTAAPSGGNTSSSTPRRPLIKPPDNRVPRQPQHGQRPQLVARLRRSVPLAGSTHFQTIIAPALRRPGFFMCHTLGVRTLPVPGRGHELLECAARIVTRAGASD